MERNKVVIIVVAAAALAGVGVTIWAIKKKEAKKEVAQAIETDVETAAVAEEPQEKLADEFQTTESGMRYRIETEGTGNKPKAGDIVEVHYTGWVDVDGEEGEKFDSSVDRNRTFKFPLGQGRVIKGWDEAVADMKEGEIRYIILPPELGYGSRRAGRLIKPNSTLRFRVKFIKIAS